MFSTDSFIRHDMLEYILGQPILVEVLLGCSLVTGRDWYCAAR